MCETNCNSIHTGRKGKGTTGELNQLSQTIAKVKTKKWTGETQQ